MDTNQITKEAENIVHKLRGIEEVTNLEILLILSVASMIVNTWQTHQSIKNMERDGTGGYPN